ncbi:MAG: GPR endopeptidase [Syntrophomonadaceae bacterium]
MHSFLNAFNLNIDLAVEAHDLLRGATDQEVPGVIEQVQQKELVKINTITIKNQDGAARMGKPIGTYVTIESPPLKINDPYVKNEIIAAMEESIITLLGERIQPGDTVLLVGLGNWRATPDALGPKFIEYSPITRHYHQHAPEALVEGMRPVCAIAPGVLGITGLETFEVIRGVVENVKPKAMVVVDALSATNVDRIGTTVQMGNTGIQPGAGVGNARMALTEEALGIPVIAIGCPTIVNASIIASEAIRKFCQGSGALFNETQALDATRTILSRFGGSLGVTPQEIDDIVENTARIIAMGVGKSLFPGISQEQLELYAT